MTEQKKTTKRKRSRKSSVSKEQLLDLSLESRREVGDVISILQTVLYGQDLDEAAKIEMIGMACHQLQLFSSIVEDFVEIRGWQDELLEVRHLSFGDLLRRHYQFFKKLALHKGIDFQVNCGEVPATLSTHELALDMVVKHLLREAFSMVTDGRIILEIASGEEDSTIEIGVHCQCDGMLFSADYDSVDGDDNTFSFKLASGIAKVCKWPMLVQNSRFLGVSFVIEVPYESVGDTRMLNPSNFDDENESDSMTTLEVPNLRKLDRRILVASKSDELINLITGVLGNDLLEVEGTADVNKIYSEIVQGNTDLVFVDSILPGISGMRLISKVRESQPELPLIALLPSNLPVLVEKFVLAGADSVLQLPVDLNSLFEVISFYLDFGNYQTQKFGKADGMLLEAGTGGLGFQDQIDFHESTRLALPGDAPAIAESGPVVAEAVLGKTLKNESELAQFDEAEVSVVAEYVKDLTKYMGTLLSYYENAQYEELGFLANQLGGTAALCHLDHLRDTLLGLQEYSIQGDDEKLELGLQVLKDQVNSLLRGRSVDVVIEHVVDTEESTGDDPEKIYSLLLTTGDDEMKALVEEYLGTLDTFIERMRDCYQQQDWKALREVGHEAGGVASMYGYPLYCDTAKSLNELVKKQEFELAGQKIDELEKIGKAMQRGGAG